MNENKYFSIVAICIAIVIVAGYYIDSISENKEIELKKKQIELQILQYRYINE